MTHIRESAKYVKLFEQIKSEILTGEYRSGEKIPGENELAQKYGMSRQTVRQSLSLLEQEGLIERRQGSGTYVAEKMHMGKKSWNVGVIATYISEYIFPSILRGIESELSEHGFAPVLGATQNRVDNERRILEEFMQRPIDGLIVEGTKSALPNPNIPFYQEIEKRGIPVVFFNGYYPVMQSCTYVVMNDKRGGYDAAEYLIQNGHTKIGGIFKSDDMQGLERYAGYMQCLVEKELPLNDEWIIWFNSENRSYILTDEAERIVNSLKDCTAVVCYNDEMAIKLVNALRRGGYQVPQDKELISFDRSLLSEISAIQIPSLSHPKEMLGAVAARKLIGKMHGKKEESARLEWVFSQKDKRR